MRPLHLTICVILIVLGSPLDVVNSGTCPEERQRTDKQDAVLRTGQFTAEVLMGVPYAGDADNAPPVPPNSFSDFRDMLHNSGVPIITDSLFFAFRTTQIDMKDPTIIGVPSEDIWCLARAGDSVLLSDKITHHYTTVNKVDREAQEIYFLDPWPDRIFLLENRNEAGIKAKIKGTRVVISKDDFLKVIVGLITLDNLGLVPYYEKVNTDNARSPKTMLAFALTTLDQGSPWLERSLPLLRRTVKLAKQTQSKRDEVTAAERLHLALLLLAYMPLSDQRRLAVVTELRTLIGEYGVEEITRLKKAEDFYRLGNAAGRAGSYDDSVQFYSRAIQRNGTFEEAYLYRGLAYTEQRRMQEAIKDLTTALSLNLEATVRIKDARNAPTITTCFSFLIIAW